MVNGIKTPNEFKSKTVAGLLALFLGSFGMNGQDFDYKYNRD